MQLREKYKLKPSERLSKLMREQAGIKGKITKAIASGEKTIPEIANETALDLPTTSFYVLTLTHYKILEPSGKTEDGYWRYRLTKGGT
jgi:hypothetical protein